MSQPEAEQVISTPKQSESEKIETTPIESILMEKRDVGDESAASSIPQPSTSKTSPREGLNQIEPETGPKLPADCRKQLFVAIPPPNRQPSTSATPASASVCIQSSSNSRKRSSKVFDAAAFSKFAFNTDPSSPQSVGSPVYSPSDFPPRQPDFDYSSFTVGDVVLVDRTEIGDGLRKATIVYVNKDYSSDSEYFNGHLVILKPAARERSQNNKGGKQTVYYVHYAKLDRRMDEWIDIHEIHSPVDSSNAPALSQQASSLILSDFNDPPTKKTRSQKKKAEEFQHNEKTALDYGATLARCEKVHEKATMLKNIDTIQIGSNVVRCWYFSPYPRDVITGRHLYICESCLMYFSSTKFFQMHMCKCKPAPPPGQVIYSDKERGFAVYEVIGHNNQAYCESLCLLSKLFLDHKTLYYQVDTFYFYVLCEIEADGTHHLVGHFSKENFSMNNLACIMVLPPYQRKGYGKFLIQLSYAFSCREGFIGTPEKPLSDLGKVSYRGFWWWLLINYIEELGYEEDINVIELERVTGIAAEDIISTFEPMEFVKKYKGDMCINMSPSILKFCKSLSLFTGPKLLLDTDLIQWTQRYLPIGDNAPQKPAKSKKKKKQQQQQRRKSKDVVMEEVAEEKEGNEKEAVKEFFVCEPPLEEANFSEPPLPTEASEIITKDLEKEVVINDKEEPAMLEQHQQQEQEEEEDDDDYETEFEDDEELEEDEYSSGSGDDDDEEFNFAEKEDEDGGYTDDEVDDDDDDMD